MIWLLLLAHLGGIGGSFIAGRSSMRSSLVIAAVAPALTTVWALSELATPSGTVEELVWVEGLELSLRFRVDALAMLMTLLVSGIGTLVFIYAVGYFTPDTRGRGFGASLLAFSASMLGLVLADSVWTLFIFWELTSITSFLLVGYNNTDLSVRTAARRALLITGGGGLVLLAGMLILADAAGTTVLSDLTAVGGSAATLSAVLILIAAATKSAQVPFHVWLPGAMAAPTPVSAYLHSATMVKAGVLLVAVVGTAYAETDVWKPLGLGFGIVSMLWGALGALRHRDAKLILAWGTISQLGLLITLLAVGTAKATFAAVAMLFAHALFKAALFLVVGEIDVRAGTRNIDELGGLGRSIPSTFVVALLAGASMAGVPPLLGFAAKEAAIEAVLGLNGVERVIVAGAVIGGATLTVAYTVRFLVGVFGPGPPTVLSPPRSAMTVPAVLLGWAGLVGFAVLGPVDDVVGAAAVELDDKAAVYTLLRWPGLTVGLATSLGIVAIGTALGLAIVTAARRADLSLNPMWLDTPRPLGASAADRTIDGVLDGSRVVISRIQHGSLPVYLVTMATMVALATTPFVVALDPDALVAWDSPLQAALGAGILASAIGGVFVGSRLGAALTLGAVGIGVSALFVLHGAPDLALTQLLVETIIVVGFVIGLGHLAKRFPSSDRAWRGVRLTVAALGGLGVSIALAASASAPSGRAPIEDLAAGAVAEGGGKNVVNVILTDIRALDTLGEVVVLATVTIGILALASTRPERVGE